jgi:hypothetical protein
MPQSHEQTGAAAPTSPSWATAMLRLDPGFYVDDKCRLHLCMEEILVAHDRPVTTTNLIDLTLFFKLLGEALGTPVTLAEAPHGN